MRRDDIADVASLNLGVEVPRDAGVIVVRSAGWKRALYFDLGPLASDTPTDRVVPLAQALRPADAPST